jgi:hypothetical protein
MANRIFLQLPATKSLSTEAPPLRNNRFHEPSDPFRRTPKNLPSARLSHDAADAWWVQPLVVFFGPAHS